MRLCPVAKRYSSLDTMPGGCWLDATAPAPAHPGEDAYPCQPSRGLCDPECTCSSLPSGPGLCSCSSSPSAVDRAERRKGLSPSPPGRRLPSSFLAISGQTATTAKPERPKQPPLLSPPQASVSPRTHPGTSWVRAQAAVRRPDPRRSRAYRQVPIEAQCIPLDQPRPLGQWPFYSRSQPRNPHNLSNLSSYTLLSPQPPYPLSPCPSPKPPKPLPLGYPGLASVTHALGEIARTPPPKKT